MMEQTEKRSYRRVPLRLTVTRLTGDAAEAAGGPVFTSNVSAGGMYVHLPAEAALEPGRAITFELTVPPGEGYSTSQCRVRGRGRVVRCEPLQPGLHGVAVQFTNRLSLGV